MEEVFVHHNIENIGVGIPSNEPWWADNGVTAQKTPFSSLNPLFTEESPA